MRASSLLATKGIVHGFGDRRSGAGPAVDAAGEEVARNRRRFAATLGAENELCTLRQVHGDNVAVLARSEQGERSGDALVSRVPGLLLAVTTADCVPILMADPAPGVAAAVHAGWRGAVTGVIAAAVDQMMALGAAPERIVAALGPCIRTRNYEVDRPFRDAVLEATPAGLDFFSDGDRPAHWQFDLAGYAMWRLREAGVGLIDDLGVDTVDNCSTYFSYRRSRQRGEPGYGVQLSGIVVPDSGISQPKSTGPSRMCG